MTPAPDNLLPVEEAQARLLALATPLAIEQADFLSAHGRLLAEPLAALRDQPWADLSAMDGYAIRHADLPGPWRLIGESRAGGSPPTTPLASGEVMRIFTGAPMPQGADSVLVQEEATADGAQVRLSGEGPDTPGRNIRPRASDFAIGMPLLEAGSRIGPAQIALAAMAGHATLPVRRRPRVAIIGTGDELMPIGQPLGPGQIPASNNIMLAALLTEAGVDVIDLGLFPDDLGSITAAFRAATTADIILSTGGASVGDHDLVAPAILAAGGTLDFWRIAMRPGKPLMAGRLGDAFIIGLPGNPVSAFVGATLFLLPLVRLLGGSPAPLPRWEELPTAVALPQGGIRAEYLRAIVRDGTVTGVTSRDSAGLRALAASNALIERPLGAPPARPGDRVKVLRLGKS
ncbi:MAG TPA: gephyrin-like molybdotransferase Glp [Sphingobium sp.]